MLEASEFIARLVGPLLLVNAVAVLVNRKGFQEVITNAEQHPSVVYVTGMMMLVPSLAIIQVHNLWTPDWRSLVTMFGWLGTLGGVARMVFPDRLAAWGARMSARQGWMLGGAAVSAAMGTMLTLKGYQIVG